MNFMNFSPTPGKRSMTTSVVWVVVSLVVALCFLLVHSPSSRAQFDLHHHAQIMHAAEMGRGEVVLEDSPMMSMSMRSSEGGTRYKKRTPDAVVVGNQNQRQTLSQGQQQRQVVQRASMSAKVHEGDLANASSRIRVIAEGLQGYVSSARIVAVPRVVERQLDPYGGTSSSHARFVIRVPAKLLDAAIQQISASVAKTEFIRRRATEVSADMEDLNLQLAQAQREHLLFEGLYNQTIKNGAALSEALLLLERLMTFEDTIVRLKDRVQRMKSSVSYATIELTITEMIVPVTNHEHRLFDTPLLRVLGTTRSGLHVVSWLLQGIAAVMIIRLVAPLVLSCALLVSNSNAQRSSTAVDPSDPRTVSDNELNAFQQHQSTADVVDPAASDARRKLV
jgi:hypothetical protein